METPMFSAPKRKVLHQVYPELLDSCVQFQVEKYGRTFTLYLKTDGRYLTIVSVDGYRPDTDIPGFQTKSALVLTKMIAEALDCVMRAIIDEHPLTTVNDYRESMGLEPIEGPGGSLLLATEPAEDA